MNARVLSACALLALPVGAWASAPLPSLVAEPATPLPADPVPVEPVTPLPVPAPPTIPSDLTATLSAPRTVTGRLPLTLSLKSSRAASVKVQVARDNEQNCATAPTVRVLRVGTREVVYPEPGKSPSLCAQDLRTDTLAARGQATYTRELNLAPGEYMVEGWLSGFAQGVRVKVPAQPVRVTVK